MEIQKRSGNISKSAENMRIVLGHRKVMNWVCAIHLDEEQQQLEIKNGNNNMEHDLQRDYSVLTKDDLREKMNKQIDDLCEMFLLSKADATVFLKKFQWDLQHVSERLSENKEKLLMGLDFSSAVTDSNYGNKLFSVEKNLARLTLEARDLYGEYVVRSYFEENKGSMIKQCPAPGFSYFIEFHRDIDVEEYGLNVAVFMRAYILWEMHP